MDTVTSITLLEGLRDLRNTDAWRRFADRYQPMIISFAKKLGLDDADADDVGQETVLAFIQGYREGRYERTKGRLRSWLFGVAQRKVVDIQRRKGKERVLADRLDGAELLGSIESPDDTESIWEQEWQRAVLQACLTEVALKVRPQNYQCFELYVLKEWPVKKVAEHLNMTENAVFITKNRLMSRIRKIQVQMEEVF